MMLVGKIPSRVLAMCATAVAATALAACGGGSGDVGAAQASTLDSATTTTATTSSAGGSLDAPLSNWVDTTAATAAASAVTDAATSSASAGGTTVVATAEQASDATTTSSAATTTEMVATEEGLVAAEVSSDSALTAKAAAATSTGWGTPLKPFSVNSPWNSRPVNPVLSDKTVPKAGYYPDIQSGAYSTGVYVASATDQPMMVKGPSATVGITNVDAGVQTLNGIYIPRWPAGTLPATGSDGHCEIFDPIEGKIHSFWQLKKVNGVWRATLYGWTSMKGTGWGNPAHFYQGARATGVVSSAGLIRKHEIDDGDTMYRHALAMSLTYNGLSKSPTYTFPATAADNDAASTNSGQIPEGALVMLPKSFDSSKLATPKLRKIAETLKNYGAYVVDRNVGTPFVIYVEIGANFVIHPNGWSNSAAADLETIRAALRSVSSTSGWLNGDGNPVTFSTNQNLLSMRGAWKLVSGDALGPYYTTMQAVYFPAKSTKVIQVNTNGTGFSKVAWAKPVAGQTYKVTAQTTGGGQFRISFTDCKNSANSIDSGVMNNGAVFQFKWPSSYCWSSVYAISGVNKVSTVSAQMVQVN